MAEAGRSLLLNGTDARTIGPYGMVSDLAWTTRCDSGSSGLFEVTWSMPLPAGFDHPLLCRGTLVELMDGPWKVGSSCVMAEPARGSGLSDPWTFTATGVGREAEGENSFYALDGSLNSSVVPSVAVDAAIARGLPWAGRGASVPTMQVGPEPTSEVMMTLGTLLSAAADSLGKRWGVDADNLVQFWDDPTEPTWQTTPGSVVLGTTDDEYASVVLVRYVDDSSGMLTTVAAINATASNKYRRREYVVDLTQFDALATATAQGFADGILAKSKGRLGFTEGMTLSSNELLTMGGVPADLSMVGAGQRVRVHGVSDDLIDVTGQTFIDVTLGETKYADGSLTIDVSPMGTKANDLAAVVEEITGEAA